jgi:hypothetical protein
MLNDPRCDFAKGVRELATMTALLIMKFEDLRI